MVVVGLHVAVVVVAARFVRMVCAYSPPVAARESRMARVDALAQYQTVVVGFQGYRSGPVVLWSSSPVCVA